MNNEIKYEPIDRFALDAKNPRLGRAAHAQVHSQADILKMMLDWSLEEIATSFIESKFWPHEAILCIKEKVDEEDKLVVVEGNRRLAALLYLKNASSGQPISKKWENLVAGRDLPDELFDRIPYIELENRHEVDAFLGFRHVTGIKEWAPAEKAQFITYLINERRSSYQDVMRKIGSKTETVRRNYIAFSLLTQMEEIEEIDIEKVEDKFSVLFLSLRSSRVQSFLGIDINAEPDQAKIPVASENVGKLKEYTRWLFGNEENEPVVTDSRQVDRFATVLASAEGLSYLRSVKRPSLETAFKLAGGEESELIDLIETAAFNIEEALSTIHLYVENERLQRAVKRLQADARQLATVFPSE